MKYCEEYAALLDLYVDGELTAEEMARVQSHLDTCPACQSYVDDALAIRAAFPDEESAALPEGFHESVMAKIAEAAPPKNKDRLWRALFPMAAACLVLMAAVRGLPGGAKEEAPAAASQAPASSAPASSAPATYENATESALVEDSAPMAVEAKSSADASMAAGKAYFTTLTLTIAEAGESELLSSREPVELEDGATGYELSREEYETVLAQLDELAVQPAETGDVGDDALALILIQD